MQHELPQYAAYGGLLPAASGKARRSDTKPLKDSSTLLQPSAVLLLSTRVVCPRLLHRC